MFIIYRKLRYPYKLLRQFLIFPHKNPGSASHLLWDIGKLYKISVLQLLSVKYNYSTYLIGSWWRLHIIIKWLDVCLTHRKHSIKISYTINYSFYPVSKWLDYLTGLDLILGLIELKLLKFFKTLLLHCFSVVYLYLLPL